VHSKLTAGKPTALSENRANLARNDGRYRKQKAHRQECLCHKSKFDGKTAGETGATTPKATAKTKTSVARTISLRRWQTRLRPKFLLAYEERIYEGKAEAKAPAQPFAIFAQGKKAAATKARAECRQG